MKRQKILVTLTETSVFSLKQLLSNGMLKTILK